MPQTSPGKSRAETDAKTRNPCPAKKSTATLATARVSLNTERTLPPGGRIRDTTGIFPISRSAASSSSVR